MAFMCSIPVILVQESHDYISDQQSLEENLVSGRDNRTIPYQICRIEGSARTIPQPLMHLFRDGYLGEL